jgi:hypothetical protein
MLGGIPRRAEEFLLERLAQQLPKSGRPHLGACLEPHHWREEAPPRAVGPLASPILPVDAWDRLLIGDGFAGLGKFIADTVDPHRLRGHNEAVICATAPFAVFRPPKSSTGNPTIMGEGRRHVKKSRQDDKRHAETLSNHVANHLIVARKAALRARRPRKCGPVSGFDAAMCAGLIGAALGGPLPGPVTI